MTEVGLALHPDKTRIVSRKEDSRRGSYEHERFDFLGCTFRCRVVKHKHGRYFGPFTAAVSDDAAKAMRREIRQWRPAKTPAGDSCSVTRGGRGSPAKAVSVRHQWA
jgi:RNA-directed DNA polymerase